ncbi:MAG: imidazole glycerol phosphate synthase subunit HisH [Dehalococcoidia bacterium]|nr:imidazole glycerol phosphate synthase subunit HisH [Dehalococcoidia bacterium]
MIAIIDYGAGNLRSVAKAIAGLGYEARVTSSPDEVLNADAVILPGVGAAGDTMNSLEALGMADPIRQVVAQNRPFFGVCLGLQVLFGNSEEGGGQRCLDLIPGMVRRLPPHLKVPHMGWNQVSQRMAHPLFEGIPDGANFYFVHSYYADPEEKAIIAGETEYGVSFPSVIIKGNLVATQFHPEKSGDLGLKMYHNFLKFGLGGRYGGHPRHRP